MKSLPFIISKKAVSVDQADRFYNLIFNEINNICKNLESGKSIKDLRKGYYTSKVKSHLVFYRVKQARVEIIRILHERMDIETKLDE
jgi:toxin ParE1/3/4